MNLADARDLIIAEYIKAEVAFPPMRSSLEGYAIIKEELDELWDDIKAERNKEAQAVEAKQLGAMALRFLIDCC